MDTIERRVQQLERWNRILSVGLLVLGLLLAASFFYPGSGSNTKPAPSTETQTNEVIAPRVITRELVVVDQKGNPLGSLMAKGEAAFATLTLGNGRWKNRCELTSNQIAFINSKMGTRLYMGGGETGDASLSLKDAGGHTHMSLASSDDGSPMLTMGDGDSSGIQMAVLGKKALIQYFSPSSDRWEPLIPEQR